MIHTVTLANRCAYAKTLHKMFRLREQVLVGENGWKLEVDADGEERDDYDDDATVYFLALDAAGDVEVCMRGRRTTDRSMLAEVFPHLLAPGWPDVRADNVLEVSRYVVSPTYRGKRGGRVAQVFLASVEYGYAHGYERLVGLCDLHVWPSVHALPWRARMTGVPRPYAEGTAVGIEMRCEREDVISFHERLNLTDNVSFELDVRAPYAMTSPAEIETAVRFEREQERAAA